MHFPRPRDPGARGQGHHCLGSFSGPAVGAPRYTSLSRVLPPAQLRLAPRHTGPAVGPILFFSGRACTTSTGPRATAVYGQAVALATVRIGLLRPWLLVSLMLRRLPAWLLLPPLLFVGLSPHPPQAMARPMKLSQLARGTGGSSPPLTAVQPRRRLQVDAVSCDALYAAADKACAAFICSDECTRAVTYAFQATAGGGAAVGGRCESIGTGLGNRASGSNPQYVPLLAELQSRVQFSVGITYLLGLKNAANCINLCAVGDTQGNPVCLRGSKCTAVVLGTQGYAAGAAGFTCDCSVPSSLGYTGPTCNVACLTGVVGNTAQGQCTLCGDGYEPDATHSTCLPCRAGTNGTAGVCQPCAGGTQPSSDSCIDKCNTYTDQTSCMAQQSAGCTYSAFSTPPCKASGAIPCGSFDLRQASGVTSCQGNLQCTYVAARVGCEPCPTQTYSTAGVCQRCPLGLRPNLAKDGCVSTPSKPAHAIYPVAAVSHRSTATISGVFSAGIALPTIAGIAEASSSRVRRSTATVQGNINQRATFTVGFVSRGNGGVANLPAGENDQADRIHRNFAVGTAGVTMLANALGATLNVPPPHVSVLNVTVGTASLADGPFVRAYVPGVAFVPPAPAFQQAADPSPTIATLTLGGDIATIGIAGSALRLAFKRDFLLALSQAVNVAVSRMRITDVAAGSIVVTVEISHRPNGAVSSSAAFSALVTASAAPGFVLAGYTVLSITETDYGDHVCAGLGGMSPCSNGACVPGCNTTNITQAVGRRRLQSPSRWHRQLQTQDDVAVAIAFEVAGDINVAPLLISPGFHTTFTATLAAERMEQDVVLSGSCSCRVPDTSGVCTAHPGGGTLGSAAECVFQGFTGRRFDETAPFTFLAMNDSLGNLYPEPFDRGIQFADAQNLANCKHMCHLHPDCNAFVFQPVNPPAPTPARARPGPGCSFAKATSGALACAGANCGVVDGSNPTWYNLYVDLRQFTPTVDTVTYSYAAVNVSVTAGWEVHTVMPYSAEVIMDGEDVAGSEAAKALLSNAALFSSILATASMAVNRTMLVTAATPVQTAYTLSCPAGQWFQDPYCYNCTVCAAGTEKTADCTATSDANCVDCAAQDGIATHYSTDGLKCQPCSAPCLGGIEYEAILCTPVSNRVCKRCPQGTVPTKVCNWKQLSRAQPYGFDGGSHTWHLNPSYRNTGRYTCPWKCVGNQKPKLQRTYGIDTAHFPEGHPRDAPHLRSSFARAHGDGFYGFTCKGRDVTGQMMWGATSAGRICAPQKNLAEQRPARASVATTKAELANDMDQMRSCICVRNASSVAWWSMHLDRVVTNATLYLHANDCCVAGGAVSPRPVLRVLVGDTGDYNQATECGSYTPAGTGAVLAVVRCHGTGQHIFVASAGQLALADVQLYDLQNLDVGVGHPREWQAKAQRGGRWVDDSPNGITSKLGSYALGITPHRKFFDRFSNEFQTAGQQHVTQEQYLTGEYTNRPVYTGTHVSSSDCSHLRNPVTGSATNTTRDGLNCGRTSRRWNHTEEGPYGSVETFGPTGMQLGTVEVLTDYTRDNPIHVAGQPITAAQAYYISVGQNPRGASVDTPWNYVEQWGWLLDKTWFNKNVRRMPNQAPAGKDRQSEMTADDETAIAAAKAAYSQQNGQVPLVVSSG